VLLGERADRVEGRVDPVLGLVARELERDERRTPVLRELTGVVAAVGAAHVLHVLRALEPSHDIVHDRPEPRVVGAGTVAALHEHALRGLVREVLRDRLVRAAGLADAEVGVVERPRPDRAADDDGDGHEREPAEDCLLAMLSAPPAGARCEVARSVHGK